MTDEPRLTALKLAMEYLRGSAPIQDVIAAAQEIEAYLAPAPAHANALPSLGKTDRDKIALQLFQDGKTNVEVAAVLGIRPNAIQRMKRRLGIPVQKRTYSDAQRQKMSVRLAAARRIWQEKRALARAAASQKDATP